MSTYTSQAMARELADLLKKWLASSMPVCVESNDANGDPTILFSADATPVAGEKVLLIRIKMVSNPTAKDILGNSAIQFGPHRVQLLTEANAGAGGADVNDVLSTSDLLPVLIEIGRKGCEVEWYQTATTVAVTVAALDTAEAAGSGARWFDLYKNVLAAS